MAREMKDSGIEWMGKIPVEWNLCKQKYLISLINGRAYSDTEFEIDGKYKILRVGNLFSNPQWYTSSLELDPEKYCVDGDLLYAWSMSYAPVIWHGEKVIYHYHIWKTVLSSRIEKKFAYYYFLVLTDALMAEKHETTMSFVTMGVMNNSYIAYPDKYEQKMISDYLNRKSSIIDSLLLQTRASIEEYKKLKQAVITQAVTKGIRPDRPMKDSGIEWVGEIPDDWTVQRIKNVAQINGRIGFRGYTTDDLVDEGEGAITLSPSNICELKIVYDKCSYISWDKYEESPEIQIENGDIIFVKTGSSYGKSGLVSNLPLRATINPQLVVFKNIVVNNRFFLYALQTPSIRNEIEGIVSGGTIPTMGQEKMKNFHLCVPGNKEQLEIADYLDCRCVEFDRIIALKESIIKELEKMKKSLIYEYVTGKKEVPI